MSNFGKIFSTVSFIQWILKTCFTEFELKLTLLILVPIKVYIAELDNTSRIFQQSTYFVGNQSQLN